MTGPWPGAAEEEEEPGADADENDTEPEPDLAVNRVAPRLPGPPPMGNLPPAARTTPEMPLIVQSERARLDGLWHRRVQKNQKRDPLSFVSQVPTTAGNGREL